MECFKYGFDGLLCKQDHEDFLTIEVTNYHAGKIIGPGGKTVTLLRKKYDAKMKIFGQENDKIRVIKVSGKQKFHVYGQILKIMYMYN